MRDGKSPLDVIVAGTLIAAIALLWTLILPGLVAFHGGTFYEDSPAFKERVPQIISQLPEVKAKVDAASLQQEERLRKIKLINSLIAPSPKPPTAADVSMLLQLQAQLERDYASVKAPVSVIPFYLNPQMLLWPSIYTCLGWLLLLCPPSDQMRLRWDHLHLASMWRRRRTFAVGFCIYGIYEWPLWLRNFVFQKGRTVFAYPNYDIDRGSFIVQEIVIFGFALLLAGLWTQWSNYYRIEVERLSRTQDTMTLAFDPALVERLSATYGYWQLCSIILAIGFIYFTYFFWALVAQYNDQRYLLSAINAHMLWTISWLMISLPLILNWQHWEGTRSKAIAGLARELGTPQDSCESRLKLLLELRPVSRFNIITSNVSVVVSFALPLIQLFHR